MSGRARFLKQSHGVPNDNDAWQTFPEINYRLKEEKGEK